MGAGIAVFCEKNDNYRYDIDLGVPFSANVSTSNFIRENFACKL